MALRDLGADFEHYRVVEFDSFAMKSYNAIHGTDFQTTDIRNIRGSDLGITDTDKYCYIMTYSFPCQDLSVAGKQAGMSENSNTRSSLLWQVKRLLNETENLPQILLLENVPAVHSEKNMPDFQKWIEFLESKGYSNYWQDLNAKDYGVAQNRERCFMVSLLGEWNYKFPQPIPLTKTMKDYLEDEVDEKYYINTEKARELIDKLIENGTLDRRNDFVIDNGNFNQRGKVHGEDSICRTIIGSGHAGNEPKVLTCDLTTNNPRVGIQVSNCITAREDRGISNLKSIGNGVVKQIGNLTDGSKRKNHNQGRVYDTDFISSTLNAAMGEGGNLQPFIVEHRNFLYRIRKLTPLECWRLMDFSDDDFHKAESVNSNSQLYKQAGNSLIRVVMAAIMSQLNIKGIKPWNEMSDEERRNI